MRVVDHPNCPNFGNERIDPSFIVLHYTACSLAKTLEIFFTPEGPAAHFVIDLDGSVHQIITNCLSGICYRGAHAGKSILALPDSRSFESLNQFSIGIELVNFNGHVFFYPEAQLQGLTDLCRELFQRYPNTNHPEHILGHADIAGFRGKIDPGSLFPWHEILCKLFPSREAQQLADLAHRRNISITPASKAFLEKSLALASPAERSTDDFWMNVSLEMERLNS